MFRFRVTGKGSHVHDDGTTYRNGDIFVCNRRIDQELVNKFEFLGEVDTSEQVEKPAEAKDVTVKFPNAQKLGKKIWFEGRNRYFISSQDDINDRVDDVAMKKAQVDQWLEKEVARKADSPDETVNDDLDEEGEVDDGGLTDLE